MADICAMLKRILSFILSLFHKKKVLASTIVRTSTTDIPTPVKEFVRSEFWEFRPYQAFSKPQPIGKLIIYGANKYRVVKFLGVRLIKGKQRSIYSLRYV